MEAAGKSIDTDTLCTETETKLCESCDFESLKTPANGICREFKEYMCSTCFKDHRKGKPCRHHVFLSLEELTSLSLGSESKDVTKCEIHDNETIKFYCFSHDVVGCGDCMVLGHKICIIEYIKDLATKSVGGNIYKAVVKRVDDLEEQKTDYGKEIEKSKGEIERMTGTALKEIRQFRSEINEYFENAEATLISEVQALKQERTMSLEELETKLKSLHAELEKVKSMLNIKLHDENTLFINVVHSKSKVSDIIEGMFKIMAQNEKLKKKFEFIRNEDMVDQLNLANSLGSLTK